MKTTNAENDGKANDRQIDILSEEYPVDAAEIAFLRGLRRGLANANAFTVPGSALDAKLDDLIREAAENVEAVEALEIGRASCRERVFAVV